MLLSKLRCVSRTFVFSTFLCLLLSRSPHVGLQISNELYAQLLDLGFDDFTARLALIRTGNSGVEEVCS